MTRLILMTMAAALLAPAQEKAPAPSAPPVAARVPGIPYIQRVYQVQHADTDEIYSLVYTSPGQGQTPVLRRNAALKAITVYGTSDEVRSIMENLKALDVPRPSGQQGPVSFNLTTYILIAGYQGELPGPAVPESLAGVTAELQRVFGLKEFRVLEANTLRASEGERMGVSGNAGPVGAYSLYFRGQFEGSSGERVLRMSSFSFVLNPKGGPVRFETAFHLKEGQQAVVGTANDGTNRSIILVLSARTVQ